MSELLPFAFAFPTEAASRTAFTAVMELIDRTEGGAVTRLDPLIAGAPPALVIFANKNTDAMRVLCRRLGGKPATLTRSLLAHLLEDNQRSTRQYLEAGGPLGEPYYERGTMYRR